MGIGKLCLRESILAHQIASLPSHRSSCHSTSRLTTALQTLYSIPGMLLEDCDHGVVGVDALWDGGRAGLGVAAAPVPAPVASAAATLVLPIRPPPTSATATATSARATFKVNNTV